MSERNEQQQTPEESEQLTPEEQEAAGHSSGEKEDSDNDTVSLLDLLRETTAEDAPDSQEEETAEDPLKETGGGFETSSLVYLAILTVGVLSQKQSITRFQQRIERFELNAAVKFLVITFIVLPVLPNKSLDAYFTLALGEIAEYEQDLAALFPGCGLADPAATAACMSVKCT